ncbi:MAG: hypothetical protein AABX89_04110 [Candidatus Thermoplasmatota archaeon]
MMDAVMALVGVALLVTPLALAFLCVRLVLAFEKEAFGHLRRAARNLRILCFGVFLYYAVVVASSLPNYAVVGLFSWPLHAEATALYVRLIAINLAFFGGLMIAKELYHVTQPGRLHDDA